MDKNIKVILILAIILLVVIIWVGIKNKPQGLPKVRGLVSPLGPTPISPDQEKDKLSPEQLERLDAALKELEARKKTVTAEEARALEDLQKILEKSKQEGRLIRPGEVGAILLPPPVPEDIAPPQPPEMPEGQLNPPEAGELLPEPPLVPIEDEMLRKGLEAQQGPLVPEPNIP